MKGLMLTPMEATRPPNVAILACGWMLRKPSFVSSTITLDLKYWRYRTQPKEERHPTNDMEPIAAAGKTKAHPVPIPNVPSRPNVAVVET
eukprot:CAMPEP_0206189584 /NCGR_PEP_ID=MMETSP0166-20121206/4250_1 /ASSEMBLY_ACC=CAM_ASM_000260 /TAXON_ID=95228 /ORGANISM="Vannella robusta, Strain DIVA3 518/3/11/1/6" /LENGTH=89 /DNA_ID=CAMNT_0053605517 /DNA_START=448 /DNA_END=713 /DNA_ORIENTATION=-